MPQSRNLLLALAAATLSTLSFAQAPAGNPPADVGVSPRTAEEAMREAVPREDTATVTSTGESPAVSQEAVQVQERATDAAGTEAATTTTTEVEIEQGTRAPRADRN